MLPKILIVEDEDAMRRILTILLSDLDVEIFSAKDGLEGLELIEKERFHVIISDLKMPKMDGMELLSHIRKLSTCPVIIITAFGSIEKAVEAVKAGAFDFITKPFEEEKIKVTVSKALEVGKLIHENQILREEIEKKYNIDKIIGYSPEICNTLSLACDVSMTDTTVLIMGESGTGKELLAKVIHYNSKRKRGPFIAINCAALPENLLESELFGYEKGAFTGAEKRKLGRFELASGGTIFLDEISEMNITLQSKLLRVLQEKEIERLGGVNTVKVDVRIIAATNRDIESMVAEGKFRKDLYYRISVFPITLPPLRDRGSDIIILAKHFLKQFALEMGKKVPIISKEAETLLLNHTWEGNIRELENAMERAIILAKDDKILPSHLPFQKNEKKSIPQPNFIKEIFTLPPQGLVLEDLEKSLVIQALERCNYNKSKAAKLLGLTRATLRYRIDKYRLNL